MFRLGVHTQAGLTQPGLPGLAAPGGADTLRLLARPPLLSPLLARHEADVGGLEARPLPLLLFPPVHTIDTGTVVALLVEEDSLVGELGQQGHLNILLQKVGNNLLRHPAPGPASFSQHLLVLQPFEADELGVSAVV